jgi:hypothetical protein
MKRWVQAVIGLVILMMAVPGAVGQAKPAEARTVTVSVDELEALRGDAKKMQVMIGQMRTNLAFVATSSTPLKHQFELEIDMWQVVLDQMERRIGEMERDGKVEK